MSIVNEMFRREQVSKEADAERVLVFAEYLFKGNVVAGFDDRAAVENVAARVRKVLRRPFRAHVGDNVVKTAWRSAVGAHG